MGASAVGAWNNSLSLYAPRVLNKCLMREGTHPPNPTPQNSCGSASPWCPWGVKNSNWTLQEGERARLLWEYTSHACFLLTGGRSASCFLCDVVIYKRPSNRMGENCFHGRRRSFAVCLSWNVTPEAVPASVSCRNPVWAAWHLWEERRGDGVRQAFREGLSQTRAKELFI